MSSRRVHDLTPFKSPGGPVGGGGSRAAFHELCRTASNRYAAVVGTGTGFGVVLDAESGHIVEHHDPLHHAVVQVHVGHCPQSRELSLADNGDSCGSGW